MTAACERLETTLDDHEALLVLEPWFEAVREQFVEAGLDAVARTRLAIDSRAHDVARHFAGCREDGLLVVVAPELCELPTDLVSGILAHELGHAADFLYPGRFALARAGVQVRLPEQVGETQWVRMVRAWQDRDADVVEQTADRIAEGVLGVPIGYVGPCRLQALGVPRKPRPRGLR